MVRTAWGRRRAMCTIIRKYVLLAQYVLWNHFLFKLIHLLGLKDLVAENRLVTLYELNNCHVITLQGMQPRHSNLHFPGRSETYKQAISNDKHSGFTSNITLVTEIDLHLPIDTTQMFGSRRAGDSGPQNSSPTATPECDTIGANDFIVHTMHNNGIPSVLILC